MSALTSGGTRAAACKKTSKLEVSLVQETVMGLLGEHGKGRADNNGGTL